MNKVYACKLPMISVQNQEHNLHQINKKHQHMYQVKLIKLIGCGFSFFQLLLLLRLQHQNSVAR
jgi:hypothetical protein